MYRTKSRDLPNNTGEVADTLFNTTSSTGNIAPTFIPYLGDESYWKGRYEAAKVSRSTARSFSYSNPGSEVIEWNSLGKDQYNPCCHRKVERVNFPYLAFTELWSYSTKYNLTPYYRQPNPSYAMWSLKTMQHPSVDYQGARARAWHSMQPRFEGEVNMLNFLFELKDFRDIAEHIFKQDMLSKIMTYRKAFMKRLLAVRPNVNRGKNNNAYQPHIPDKDFAEDYLAYQFAVKPLLADLGEILIQLSLMAKHAQSMFLVDGLAYQKSHFSEEIHREETMTYYANNSCWFKYGVQNVTTFTATLRYKYDYSMRDTFNAWLKYWGLCPSFTSFWNALPFSFLADYVVQIGNSIRAMEHDPHVRLHDWTYGESLKTNYIAGYATTGTKLRELVLNGNYISEAYADRAISGTIGSVYTRHARSPYYGPAAPRWKLPSGRQFLNVAALVRCFL